MRYFRLTMPLIKMTKTKPKIKKPAKKKPVKKLYRLIVQIGKKKLKGKVYKFNKNTRDGLVKALLTINIPKMMEVVTFTLKKDGKTSTRSMNAFQARRVFNNKLNAFFLIKHMHWVFK